MLPMLLCQIVCLLIGTVFFRCVSIFDIFPLGINYIGLTPSICCSVAYYFPSDTEF